MKWIYGKQDFKTLERGEENCYLLTNGLGGFSSMNMLGGVSRNDHAFFMACINPPNHICYIRKEEGTECVIKIKRDGFSQSCS